MVGLAGGGRIKCRVLVLGRAFGFEVVAARPDWHRSSPLLCCVDLDLGLVFEWVYEMQYHLVDSDRSARLFDGLLVEGRICNLSQLRVVAKLPGRGHRVLDLPDAELLPAEQRADRGVVARRS